MRSVPPSHYAPNLVVLLPITSLFPSVASLSVPKCRRRRSDLTRSTVSCMRDLSNSVFIVVRYHLCPSGIDGVFIYVTLTWITAFGDLTDRELRSGLTRITTVTGEDHDSAQLCCAEPRIATYVQFANNKTETRLVSISYRS